MNSKETIETLKSLKLAYPKFYINMKKEEMNKILEIWQNAFKDDKFENVQKSVNKLLETSKYPPSIAEVREKIEEKNKIDSDTWANANLNSSYWYEIEREWCEKNNKPYYDITKGPEYELMPFN